MTNKLAWMLKKPSNNFQMKFKNCITRHRIQQTHRWCNTRWNADRSPPGKKLGVKMQVGKSINVLAQKAGIIDSMWQPVITTVSFTASSVSTLISSQSSFHPASASSMQTVQMSYQESPMLGHELTRKSKSLKACLRKRTWTWRKSWMKRECLSKKASLAHFPLPRSTLKWLASGPMILELCRVEQMIEFSEISVSTLTSLSCTKQEWILTRQIP